VNRVRSLLVLVGVFILFGVSAASALACSDSWTGTAGDGLWSTATNWSSGAAPGNSDDVCLPDIGHSYTVTLEPIAGSGGGTINSLTVGTTSGSDTETLDIVGQSFVSGGETRNGEGLGLANGGTDTINATGSVVLDSTSGGGTALPSDTPGGPAGLGDSPFGGGAILHNFGQIVAESSDFPTWNEQLNANVTNEPGGSITVVSGSLQQQTSNTVTNQGTVTTDAGGDYDVTSGGTNDVFTNDGTVANNGTFEVGGQTGTFTQNGPVTGNPVLIEAGSTLADQAGAGAFTLEFDTPILTGTIPAGQTVTVRGASAINGGETQNGTTLSLGGTTVTNDGTLVLDATADGTKMLPGDTVGGGVTLGSGTLANAGTLQIKTDDPTWTNVIEATLANGHAGTATVSGALKQDTAVPTTNDGMFTLTPGAVYTLLQGGSFTNAADGTLATQIASASSFGSFVLQSPCCSGPGTVTAGGTLTPQLVGGFAPSAGAEFRIVALNGGAFTGTFPTVSNNFTGDYKNETASPAFVGVIYGGASTGGGGGGGGGGAGGGGGGATPATVTVRRIAGGTELFTVALSCRSGGAACRTATIAGSATKYVKASKKAKAKTKRTTVLVATGSATLGAGASKTLTLRLNATGRALLKTGTSLTVKVKVTSGGKTIRTVTVKVHKPAKAKKKKPKKG
jgi:hypothetical protein